MKPTLASALLLLSHGVAAGCAGRPLDGDVRDDPSAVQASAATVVSLPVGKVQGDVVGESLRFLKLPYAKPPVGALRFRAPEKAEPWTGVRHETAFAPGCAQNASSQGGPSLAEDCLYLNVFTPRVLPTNAPVMVWIHGGGNFAGSAGDKVPTPLVPPAEQPLWYDGQILAARYGVVVVSLNYRLGPLGFFAHPALAGEGSPLGNQGLHDQQRALAWVRDNIAGFGGDPGNVTIFGESAGSSDVCFHVVSPKSRGLFHRAISQSGGCTVSIEVGRDNTAAGAAAGMQVFAEAVGCGAAPDVLACLRTKSTAELMAKAAQPAPSSGATNEGPYRFEVVVDGEGGFVPESPRALFARGDVAKIPYILGSNADEGTLFVLGLSTPPRDDAAYLLALRARFGDAAERLLSLYPASKFAGDYRLALARVIGDSSLVCGTHDTARRAAAAGLRVYMYNFELPWRAIPGLVLGAAHAAEVGHVFGSPYAPDEVDRKISDAMGAYWTSFARTGDPNASNPATRWPLFVPAADAADQRLQFGGALSVVNDFRREECAFWRSVYDTPARR